MNEELEILKAAAQDGINTARMTTAQYRFYQLKIRSMREKVRDTYKAVESIAHTSVGARVVPLYVFEQNQRICEANTCGKYRILRDGAPACHACGCAGRLLASKQRDRKGFCPLPTPLWDNRTVPPDADVNVPTPELADGGRAAHTGDVLVDRPNG